MRLLMAQISAVFPLHRTAQGSQRARYPAGFCVCCSEGMEEWGRVLGCQKTAGNAKMEYASLRVLKSYEAISNRTYQNRYVI